MGSVAHNEKLKVIAGKGLLSKSARAKKKAKLIKVVLNSAKKEQFKAKFQEEIHNDIPSEEMLAEQSDNLIVKYRLKARKLARSILRRWHARLDLQEVDSIVDLSLCEATVRYNPAKGASFMTFLFYHLRGNLIRAVSTAATSNTIPFSSCESLQRTMNGADGDSTANFRGANALEIAEALTGQEVLLPDEILLKKEMIAESSRACSELDPLEREIIERIYLQEQQLMDIAHMLGYSRCHISRVKRKALEVLQGELSKTFGITFENAPGDEEDVSTSERRKVFRRKPRSKVAAAARQKSLKLDVDELKAA